MALLDEEIETFKKNKENLLQDHLGKYVLIKKDKIIGTFFDKRDAINQGYKRFPNQEFLVKEIQECDEEIKLSNYGVKVLCPL